MEKSPSQKNTDNTCPYLGILSDPQTAMAYPSGQNFCYHVTPPASPGSPHQQQYCLAASHTRCERFAIKSNLPIPAAFLVDNENPRPSNGLTFRLIILGLIGVGIIGLTAWLLIRQAWITPSPTQFIEPSTTVKPVAMEITTPHPTKLPTSTATPMATVTLAPSHTASSTPVALRFLETPFGTTRQLILHRVAMGESLIKLSGEHNTTIEAIRAINVGLEGTLWANAVIIIPVNQTDVTGLPKMVGIEIVEQAISLQALASQYEVDLSVLIELNDLPGEYRFQVGEWVVIPE